MNLCNIPYPSGRCEAISVIKIKELLEINDESVIDDEMARLIILKTSQSSEKKAVHVNSIEKIILLSKPYQILMMDLQRKFRRILKVGNDLIEILDIEKIFMTNSLN